MRHETRDELRHETFRLGRPFASRLTSHVSRLMSHVSLLWVVASLLLVGLVWALFGQTGDFEFLRLDDPDYTYRCAFVKDGLSWANVREAFTNVRHGGIWMPVTNLSYMCGITLFGPGAGAHHLVNVAVHAAVSPLSSAVPSSVIVATAVVDAAASVSLTPEYRLSTMLAPSGALTVFPAASFHSFVTVTLVLSSLFVMFPPLWAYVAVPSSLYSTLYPDCSLVSFTT